MIVRNLVVATCVVFASLSICSAQSIIQSVSSRVALSSASDHDGRITLQASVTSEQGGAVPGGTIQFIDETTLQVLGWADVAAPVIVIDRLAPGPHRFRADYSGTMAFLPLVVQPGQSDALLTVVREQSVVTLSSSDNPCAPGALVTLTAMVVSRAAAPTGTVTFRDGPTLLAQVGLDQAGTASFTTSALAEGARAIVAEYDGDGSHAPAASARLHQDVGHLFQSSELR
ncbi:MAG: hypothetical protein JWQ94_1489 [Tardiphaga sp.]|nr:hypothetical protein [Tardiphaga sp.]